MRLLLESTGEGIYGIDLQGRCTFINQAAAAMLGYAPAEVIGQEMHALIHHHRSDGTPYPVEQCPIYRAIQQRSGVRMHDEVLWRKDGTYFAADYSSFPIMKLEHIQGAVVTFQDITQTKQLEEQFRQAQKMEVVGQLAGGVAHDFNNLLTIISGYSEMMLASLPHDDRNRALIQEIYNAGERAAHLTRQLLAFSRKQVVEQKVLNLNAVMDSTGLMLRRLIGEDVRLTAVPGPSLDRVKADPGQIEQVLMNLVVNARDAMPQGGSITIETTNVDLDENYAQAHAEVKPGRYVLLAVSDTGSGMTEEVQRHLFEPFFTTKGPGKGTGLGLATVYGIVKQSDGHVWLYSEVGRGTTFKIYLPSVGGSATEDERRDSMSPGPSGTGTILLVEDDDQVRTMTCFVLQTFGYTVLEARNGEEAMRACQTHQGPVDLLITDVVMPGVSGRQVAEAVTTLKPTIKVLYVSGYTDDAVVRHGILQAETAFLQKPFTTVALATKVRSMLNRVDP